MEAGTSPPLGGKVFGKRERVIETEFQEGVSAQAIRLLGGTGTRKKGRKQNDVRSGCGNQIGNEEANSDKAEDTESVGVLVLMNHVFGPEDHSIMLQGRDGRGSN